MSDFEFEPFFSELTDEGKLDYHLMINDEFEPVGIYPEHLPDQILSGPVVEPTTSLDEPKGSRSPLAYAATQMVLANWTLICVNGRVLVYNERYGFFEEHSDRQLEILVRKSVSTTVDQHLDVPKMRDVLHRLRSNPALQVDPLELDYHCFLVNFRNGVYDIHSDRISSHSPDWRFTSYIDADYRPGNNNGGQQFLQFLQDCTNSDSYKINSLQEVSGYIISNEWRAKKFFALIGVPHSGKSVWLILWKSLIGTNFTTSLSLQQLGKNRFMSAELLGSKLNLSAEMEEIGTLRGISLIKSITGGDMVTAERKGSGVVKKSTV